MKSLTLDIGCGMDKFPGSIGIDKVRGTAADVIADLDRGGLAFRSNMFSHIQCQHVIEHVRDAIVFIEEIYRVARPDATVVIRTPHASSAYSYQDPTHVRHFTLRSLDHFCEASHRRPGRLRTYLLRLLGFAPVPSVHRFYSSVRFEYITARLVFPRIYRALGIEFLANRFPDFYELYLMWILPCRDVHLVLMVKK